MILEDKFLTETGVVEVAYPQGNKSGECQVSRGEATFVGCNSSGLTQQWNLTKIKVTCSKFWRYLSLPQSTYMLDSKSVVFHSLRHYANATIIFNWNYK